MGIFQYQQVMRRKCEVGSRSTKSFSYALAYLLPLISQLIPCYGRENSLFDLQRFHIRSAQLMGSNSKAKLGRTSDSIKFPVIFPVSREPNYETGSQLTASSASHSCRNVLSSRTYSYLGRSVGLHREGRTTGRALARDPLEFGHACEPPVVVAHL